MVVFLLFFLAKNWAMAWFNCRNHVSGCSFKAWSVIDNASLYKPFRNRKILNPLRSVIKNIANHVLTDKGLAGFLADIEKAGIKIV